MGAQATAQELEEFFYPDFEDAACVGSDPEIFFPNSTSEAREAAALTNFPYQYFPGKAIKPNQIAKDICMSCTHMAACRDFALDNSIRYGIWGGTTEMDRRRLKKLMDRELDA